MRLSRSSLARIRRHHPIDENRMRSRPREHGRGHEVGPENKKLRVGDRVVVPFTISCGECFFCRNGFYSGCERTNPDHDSAAKLLGNSPAGLFGYSHLLGGYAGGQAGYRRVPYADVGPIKVPDGFSDEQVLFLSDIFPTGYMAAEFCALKGGETVAIWGCGPVGQFAIRSAFLLGADRVLAIDTVPERLALAQKSGTETIDFIKKDFYDRVIALDGHGADACIDAVGTDAEPSGSRRANAPNMTSISSLPQMSPGSTKPRMHCGVRAAPSRSSRPISRLWMGSMRSTKRSGQYAWTRCWPMPAVAWERPFSTRTSMQPALSSIRT
jgi:threonine dehydrogenase-like Zn-dependent dehydrogenase